MQQQQQQAEATPATVEASSAATSEKPSRKPASSQGSSAAASDVDSELPFVNVLITPKLSFSLPRKAHWRVPDDIPQAELQEGFLSRFPVRVDATGLSFKCATPAQPIKGQERLVYRIGSVNGGDEERVLLSILSSLDKAYSAKYERQLEEARADLLSSSVSFQCVADEVRAAQAAASKKWEREVRSLKEQMSTNQKRLFLLEREKEGLQKTSAASDELTTQLRRSLEGLSAENTALRERMAELDAQVNSLREAVSDQMVLVASPASGQLLPPPPLHATCHEVACQTSGDESDADAASRLAMDRWQQQLSAMSDWLKTGAALLNGANGPPGSSLPVVPPLGVPPMATSPLSHASGGDAQSAAVLDVNLDGAIIGEEPSSVC